MPKKHPFLFRLIIIRYKIKMKNFRWFINEEMTKIDGGAYSDASKTSFTKKEIIKTPKNGEYINAQIICNRMMSKKPYLFAKISVNQGNKIVSEKLDTYKFKKINIAAMNFMNNLLASIRDSNTDDYDYYSGLTRSSLTVLPYEDWKVNANELLEDDRLKKYKELDFFRDFLKLKIEIYEYFKPYLESSKNTGKDFLSLDLHKGNFGCEIGSHKIKCFDPCSTN